jgi:hypothetical protein
MTNTKYNDIYMPGTKKQNQSKTASRKKRCPNGSRRDKKSGDCAQYKGIQVFKELKDQKISNKPTVSLETLDNGAILKVYNEGELISQRYVNEKILQQSKVVEEKGNKLIMKAIKRIKKDPTVLQKDKKFLRFQKKMAQKRGGATGKEGEPSEEFIEIQVQESVMEQIQSPKIAKLQAKLASLESELQKEVELYYSSWSTFNGILAIINVVGTVAGALEFGGFSYYFNMPIISGFLTNLSFYITNIIAYFFSTEDINTIQTIINYIVFIVDNTVFIAFTIIGVEYGPLIIQESLMILDVVLIYVKNHMISTREKTKNELQLERDIIDTKVKLIEAME